MSNSLFGNPKIALGFAGGVVAIALVASVALNEFKPGADQAPEPVAATAAPAAPAPAVPQANQGFAQGAGSGWGDAGSGWGAAPQASASASKPSFDGPSAADPFADLGAMDNTPTRNAGGRRPDGSSGPTITSRAAPGAPPVESPGGESQGILNTTG